MQLSTQSSKRNCILEADSLKRKCDQLISSCVKSQSSWPPNVSQPLRQQHRGLLYLAQCLFWVSLTFPKLRYSLFTQRTLLWRLNKAFLLDPRFPHPEGLKVFICPSHHMTLHLWLLSFQGVPQRDQITAHRPQSANLRVQQVTEVPLLKWLLRPLVPCDHWTSLCKGHTKIKLQTQFPCLEGLKHS